MDYRMENERYDGTIMGYDPVNLRKYGKKPKEMEDFAALWLVWLPEKQDKSSRNMGRLVEIAWETR